MRRGIEAASATRPVRIHGTADERLTVVIFPTAHMGVSSACGESFTIRIDVTFVSFTTPTRLLQCSTQTHRRSTPHFIEQDFHNLLESAKK
jgi:hypothetical protein